MSVEEVERILLYTLESSVSCDEVKRTEALNLMKGLEENMNNAGPLFQLLLKYQLTQQSVSMSIIRLLESHLTVKGTGGESTSSPIATQLRVAFIDDFLRKVILPVSSDVKSFLKNAICKFLLVAFINERLSGTWPNGLYSLIEALKDSRLGRELLLKFCLILTEEVNNSHASTLQNEILMRRNAEIRDSMRLNENALLCDFWRGILKEFTTNNTNNADEVSLALDCLAAYSSWIDVSLVVEGETLKIIYFLLQTSQVPIQEAAVKCLSEIVLKGMSGGDKIALAEYMNLTSVFEAVCQRGRIDSFFGKACCVLNNLGYSLSQQVSLNPNNREIHAQVVQYTSTVLLPHLINFLKVLSGQARQLRIGNDFWEESLNSLLPFIGSFFELARGMREELNSEQVSFMGQFLVICLDLLEVSDGNVCELQDSEGGGGEDECDATIFTQIRTGLFQAFESVLWLQGHATIALMNAKRLEGESLGRCELLCRLVLRTPEGMRGAPIFSISINGTYKPTPIAELCTWIIERVPERHEKLLPLVAAVLARYSSTAFLDQFPERIDGSLRILMRLVESRNFRERDCELFLRFVKNLKGKLASYSMALLEVLQGPLNQERGASSLAPSSLYELAGFAVSSLDPRTVQMDVITGALLQQALNVSMREASRNVSSIECLGAFAKGFMSDSCLDSTTVRAWFTEYSQKFLLSRVLPSNPDAAYLNGLIGFTQRMIPLIQSESLGLVRDLTGSVLRYRQARAGDELGVMELMSQLLSLHSAALFKLRDQFACPAVLGELWPSLLVRLQELFNEPIQGTDDLCQYVALSRAMLSFLQALASFPSATACTLAGRRDSVLEGILVRMTEQFITASSVDSIALLRSLCGVLNRAQGCLSVEFLCCRMVPLMLQQSLPMVFANLDPCSRKSILSLPAAYLSLIQDLLGLLRSLHQQGHGSDSWSSWNGIDLLTGDLKETRGILVSFIANSNSNNNNNNNNNNK